MLKRRARLVETGLRALDLLTLGVGLWVAHAVAPGDRSTLLAHPAAGYGPLLATVLVLWIAASSLVGLYDAYRTRPTGTEILRIVHALALVALGVALTAWLWLRPGTAWAVVELYPVCAFLLLVAGRLTIRQAAGQARRRGYNMRRFAVVGHGDLAREVVQRFEAHQEWGYEFAGYVVDDALAPGQGRPVLCRLGELGAMLHEQVLDQVVFAVPFERLAEVQAAARLCELQGITVRVCVDFLRGGIARLESSDLDGLPSFAYSTVPADGLPLSAKRLFDVATGATALILLAPLLAVIALAIRCESRGPALFRQRRVGLNGRAFDLLKFRSMNQDAEAQLAGLAALNEASGPVFKMRRDPRVTRIGRLLRLTSLDEVPQFWNVLRGEMSIVGPRPPLPAEVLRYQRWQRRRLSVRPGITCTWQISGRSELSFDKWMQLDLEYIDTWSLWGDLRIFARTIPAVLAARGAR